LPPARQVQGTQGPGGQTGRFPAAQLAVCSEQSECGRDCEGAEYSVSKVEYVSIQGGDD